MIKLLTALLVALLVFTAITPAHARAAADISSLASADHEIALVFKAGTLLATFEGDNRAAAIRIDPRFRDGELWHSHPYPGLPDLSPDDLYTARYFGKMCAVSAEATCCATRVGRTWQPLSRAQAGRLTAEIYRAIKGHPRAEQIAIHRAVIAADAERRGYDYACY